MSKSILIVLNLRVFIAQFQKKITGELICYYCDNSNSNVTHEDCSNNLFGFQVTCQMDSKEKPYYGDACFVGHTGAILYTIHYINYQSQFKHL